MINGFLLSNQWFYKLPDPFRLTPYYPLDSQSLAKHLECSQRTAIRICQDLRQLKKHELIYLQTVFYGLIPDPEFMRGKWFFREGLLLSHNHDLTIDMRDTTTYAVLRHNHYLLLAELTLAKDRIKELELKLGLIKTNIIQFSDFFKR